MKGSFFLFFSMFIFSCSTKVDQPKIGQPKINAMFEKYFKTHFEHTSRFQVNKVDAVDTNIANNKYYITYKVDYQDSLEDAHNIVVNHAEVIYFPADSTFEIVRDNSDYK